MPWQGSPPSDGCAGPARIYTDIFRGLPEVVIILLVGLGRRARRWTSHRQQSFPLGIAEIFRSGIRSVDPGQLEACRALGFSYPTSMQLVGIPQGVRRVLPALINQFISLLKASSLV